MRSRHLFLVLIALLLVVVITLGIVWAASNSVGPSGLTNQSSNATANQLKPTQCDSLDLASVIINANGNNQNNLVLGTAGNNSMNGRQGEDCVVGGGGNDTLSGGGGNDIILGGAGSDTIDGGAGTDICYRGGGTDNISNCETINP